MAMDGGELREQGGRVLGIVADYWDTLADRRPLPDVQPGFMRQLLPPTAPEEPEPWETILGDLERVVIAPNTHWHHPRFFAYFPTANSYPAVLGDILSSGLAPIGFTWKSSPSCTELEMAMVDWLAQAIGLPEHFLHSSAGPGGGVIQGTASEATLVALLVARQRLYNATGDKLRRSMHKGAAGEGGGGGRDGNIFGRLWKSVAGAPRAVINFVMEGVLGAEASGGDSVEGGRGDAECNYMHFPNLVAYCSDEAHSSVEKAAILGAVAVRRIATTKEGGHSLTGDALEKAIEHDVARGKIPFFVCATVGTTTVCSVDHLKSIGAVCARHGLYLHVDAAYAGAATACPEYRGLLDGVELADSYCFNPHKWMMVNFDCSAMWFRDAREVEAAFRNDPTYLKHEYDSVVADFRNWQIPLGRRFRSIKIWLVLRAIGLNAIRQHIRNQCALAEHFASHAIDDEQWELVAPAKLGLVCFRLLPDKDPDAHTLDELNKINEELCARINADRRIHLVPATVKGVFFLRLAICSSKTTVQDVDFAWNVIKELADVTMREHLPP